MEDLKSVFVTIVGRPNVGKSSLLNRLVGEKIAIVTDKPQTTRTRITGILTEGITQYVFFDTPGFHKPKTKLSDYMLDAVHRTVGEVDVGIFVSDASGPIQEREEVLLNACRQAKLPLILVLNKIDLLENKDELLTKLTSFFASYPFAAAVPMSVTKNDGVGLLMDELIGFAKPGPHFFADDALTDQSERALVAEMIREKLLLNLNAEVPHGTGVMVEKMHERENLVEISAVILCEKASHKGILIGKGGQMLKRIGTQAREEIEAFLGCKVHLECWVKVKEDWRNREFYIKELGFTKE